jgi:hypothetical protein
VLSRTYLLELLNVNIQLAAQLGFGMRKRRHLRTEGSTTRGFVFSSAALLLVLGRQALYLGIFAAQERFIMQLSHFELFADGLNFRAQTVMLRSAVASMIRMTLDLRLVQVDIQLFVARTALCCHDILDVVQQRVKPLIHNQPRLFLGFLQFLVFVLSNMRLSDQSSCS